jgi:acetyltransferase
MFMASGSGPVRQRSQVGMSNAMTIRHLDTLFDPACVAVIGASLRSGSVGAMVWRNLKDGGFAGPRWAVNPKHTRLDGEPCYAGIAQLPGAPELAVIATPPATVPGLVAALGERGTRAVIVLTAGLDAANKQALLDAARPHTLRVLGPNGLGLLAPHACLNASFAPAAAAAGQLAFVSQSGALLTAMLDWARGRSIGFSHCVSLGEQADVDFGDVIDWLATDHRTRAILLYIESIDPKRVRKFMSAARGAARNKPVLVVKAGRSSAGQAAAASHTGALAGSDLVFDAAIRRAGMLRVDTLGDLFLAAETLVRFRSPLQQGLNAAQEQLTIVTNGGGAGVMAADAAAQAGVALAPLAAGVRTALDGALPANWSRANPVDLIGDAPVARYVQAMQALLADAASGTVLFIHAPTAIVPSLDIAHALLPVVQGHRQRLLSCWLGDVSVQAARERFEAAGVAGYDTPEQAVRALAMLQTYRRNQAQLMQTPPARSALQPIDMARVRAVIDGALADGRQWLHEPEAKDLLAACGVPVVATQLVAPTEEAAEAAAQALGYPVALKIVSPQITHKSDVGGVALNLADATALRGAVAVLRERLARLAPQARLSGFAVQAMARRQHPARVVELIVGASVDALFGPVLLFGQGGTAVEVLADRAIALPPLNMALAQALVQRTRVARLLAGWRDVPAADTAAVAAVLCAMSQLLAEEPRIAELDINPLWADAQGVIALDARVRVSADPPGGAARFAIRPYPSEWVEHRQWQGRRLVLRPIRPEDEAQHRAFLESVDPEDIRLRVFYSRRSIQHSELARLTQIDYDRELALVATEAQPDGGEQTLGVVRAVCDPDNRDAEFGIVVRSDLKGLGLGRLLMDKLIAHLRQRGTQRLVAMVLKENDRMLALGRQLGFQTEPAADDAGTWRLTMPLV